MHNGVFDTLMIVITKLGDKGVAWILAAIVLMITKKYRKVGFTMAIALILNLLLGEITLKPLFSRLRPFIDSDITLLISEPHGYSFPSSHAMSSFAAATAITWYHKRVGICALVLAGLIAFSRLYLYVHYLSDIIVGSVLGVGCGIAAVFLFRFIEGKIMEKIRQKKLS
ncbi:MAG: phosphatase PAP2 family protein [Oscillospiraceae bacterium]|nr:phosphatase PAP2 family protein [Oscillospiraceae bacterium]